MTMIPYDYYARKCTSGTLAQMKLAVTLRTQEMYFETCQDFGILPCLPFQVEFPECYTDFIGKTKFLVKFKGLYREEIYLSGFIFQYPIAICRLEYDTLYKDTIPHEVAHAIIVQIYPEKKPVELGHGPEWQELASYLGANPSPGSYIRTRTEQLCSYAESKV